jgi:hypothetical protein
MHGPMNVRLNDNKLKVTPYSQLFVYELVEEFPCLFAEKLL